MGLHIKLTSQTLLRREAPLTSELSLLCAAAGASHPDYTSRDVIWRGTGDVAEWRAVLPSSAPRTFSAIPTVAERGRRTAI